MYRNLSDFICLHNLLASFSDAGTLSLSLKLSNKRPVLAGTAATFRGLLGQILLLEDRSFADSFFKPGADSDTPPPFALQLRSPFPDLSESIFLDISIFKDFSLVSELLLHALFTHAPGMRFGDAGAHILSVLCIRKTPFRIPDIDSMDSADDSFSLSFPAPLQIKKYSNLLGCSDLSFPLITASFLERINRLARLCSSSNIHTVTPEPWILDSAMSLCRNKNFHWEKAARFSATQTLTIDLSGVAGSISIRKAPAFKALFSAASFFNIGRHTSAGCGVCVPLFDK